MLIDDAEHLWEVLGGFLGERGVDVIGATGDPDGAVSLVTTLQPDAVILDWHLGGRPRGAEILAALTSTWPTLPVIVFTADPERAQVAVAMGARAVVSKSMLGAERLIEALEVMKSADGPDACGSRI